MQGPDWRLETFGQFKRPFLKLSDPVVSAPGPFREDEEIPPRIKILLHIFHFVDHPGGNGTVFRRRDVAGVFQNGSEDGDLEKDSFYDGFLHGKKGDQEEWIKVGKVIAHDNRGADGTEGFRDPPFQSRDDDPEQQEKTSVIKVIQFLKGRFPVSGRKRSCCIKRGEKEEKAKCEIDPCEEGYEKVEGTFENPYYCRRTGITHVS